MRTLPEAEEEGGDNSSQCTDLVLQLVEAAGHEVSVVEAALRRRQRVLGLTQSPRAVQDQEDDNIVLQEEKQPENALVPHADSSYYYCHSGEPNVDALVPLVGDTYWDCQLCHSGPAPPVIKPTVFGDQHPKIRESTSSSEEKQDDMMLVSDKENQGQSLSLQGMLFCHSFSG